MSATQAAGQAGPQRLAFLHMPKTAGTSLTRVLAGHWGRVRIIGQWEALRDTPPEGLADITLFAGHFFAYQLAHPALAGFAPVTVLRDPLARLFSEYRFARDTAARGQPLTQQMRYAVEIGFFEYAFSGPGAWGRHAQLFILGRKDAADRPQARPQAAVLARAKQRLEAMHAVGLTEALQTFVARLFAEAGAPPPPDLPRLLVQDEMAADGLTRAQREVLREVLAPDYALLDHARGLMLRWLDGPAPPRRPAPAAAEDPVLARLPVLRGTIGTLQKLCDAGDWADPRLRLVARAALGQRPQIHPRLWEACMAFLALALDGRLGGRGQGLGQAGLALGAVPAPLLAALRARAAHVAEAPGVTQGEDRLDLPDGGLDWAVSIAHLGRLDGEAAVRRHLAEVRRVLRPDGLCALTAEVRLGPRGNPMPGNAAFAPQDLLRLAAAAGLHPAPCLDLRLADLRENDPRELPAGLHHDPAQDLGLTLAVREEGGMFLAPVLLLLRPEPQGEVAVAGLEETIARLAEDHAGRRDWRGPGWLRLNPWGFWATPASPFSDLHATGAEAETAETSVFATAYRDLGAGEAQVQVALTPSPRMAGPAEVAVLVQEWAREDLAALRTCLALPAVAVNAPPGRAAVLRFRLAVDAACRYAILGRRVSGRPLLAAVDVQVRRAPAA